MNHAITIGELLRVLGGIIAVILILIGAMMLLAGGESDAPEEGESAAKGGCGLVAFGIIILGLMLAACGHPPPPTPPSDRIVEVKVPVATQPIKPADVPAPPAPLGPRPDTVQQQEDLLLSKICEFEAYAIKANPLLRISAGEEPGALLAYPECAAHQ